MDIIKSPQENIEAYLYNEVNIEIYEEYQDNNGNDRSAVLEFFNFLYSEFTFFKDNVENYLEIKNHFDSSLHNPNINFLIMGETVHEECFQNYCALSKLINKYFPIQFCEGVTLKSCKHIERIFTRLNYNVGNDNMSNLLNQIKSLDYEEKMEILIDMKYLSLKNENLLKDPEGITIASKCDLEIERLEKLNQVRKTETIPKTIPEIDIKPKQNKKLLLNGTKLNILERYQILNKVLNFDDTVRPLNIGNEEKNTLLSYILDIDESNARKLFNGTYKDADCRDLTPYFTGLNLKK